MTKIPTPKKSNVFLYITLLLMWLGIVLETFLNTELAQIFGYICFGGAFVTNIMDLVYKIKKERK